MSLIQVYDPKAVDLFESTKEKAQLVRKAAVEHPKLAKIDGIKPLLKKLDEVIEEFEVQDTWIRKALSSKSVFYNLEVVREALADIETFLGLSVKSGWFFGRKRLTKAVVLLQTQLRSKQTQFMTSVNLEVIAQQDKFGNRLTLKSESDGNDDDDKNKQQHEKNEEIYLLGMQSFHGYLAPKNYNNAYGHFFEAAENDHEESMYMLSICYQNGYGIDRNLTTARAWLEKAASAGSASAKNDLAMSLIAQVFHF